MLLLLPYQKRLHNPQNKLNRPAVNVWRILSTSSLGLQKKLINLFHSKSLNEFRKKASRSLVKTRGFLTLMYPFLVKSLTFFSNAQKSLIPTKSGLLSYKTVKLWSSSLMIEGLDILNFSYFLNILCSLIFSFCWYQSLLYVAKKS